MYRYFVRLGLILLTEISGHVIALKIVAAFVLHIGGLLATTFVFVII